MGNSINPALRDLTGGSWNFDGNPGYKDHGIVPETGTRPTFDEHLGFQYKRKALGIIELLMG